jgi:hypothetical protein
MTRISRLMFGFHTGSGGGNQNGLGDYLNQLNTAGITFTQMSADAFPFEAQQIMLANPAVRHNVIFRRSVGHQGTEPPSGNPDIPEFGRAPNEAAERHWGWHWQHKPPEMHQDTWLMITNEPGSRLEFDNEAGQMAVPLFGVRQRYTRVNPDNGALIYGVTNYGWLAQYELRVAQLALAQGQRYAAFGWAAGNPEPGDWEHPATLALLRLCADNPDRLAIGLHEYSWKTNDIWFDNGRLVGRFIDVYKACKKHSIPYPTIFIKEWGWTYEHVPEPGQAMEHVLSVGQYYAQFPEVRGVAIWYLGPGFNGIANQAQRLIAPLTQLTLSTEIAVDELYPGVGDTPPPPPPPPGGVRGAPRVDYRRTVHVIPAGTTEETAVFIFRQAWQNGRQTVGGSYDDAGIGDLSDRTAVLHGIQEAERQTFLNWYAEHYPGVSVEFRDVPGSPDPALPAPLLSQRDPRWANVVLGQNTGHGKTIGNWGCLLVAYTSMANYMNLAGDTPSQMNGRMVAAGAFSGQYMLPAALRTAFPNGVTYHGFKPRSDAAMKPTIAAYLAEGIPVPARVDFNPSTPQWEQHWVLLVGQTPNDWLMMDPWHGDVQSVSARYGIAGDDILEAIFYRQKDTPSPPPPPATGPARIGLHAGADSGDLSEAEFAEFRAMRPGVIKVLSSHAGPSVARLAVENPTAVFIIRAFLHFGDRTVTPSQFFDWTFGDTLRAVQAIGTGRTVLVELHNEPNLVEEGLGRSWGNGTEFGDWLTAVASMFRAHLPAGVRLMFPGLSPGGDIPQVRQGHISFLQQATRGIDACNDFGAHVYWAHNYPMGQALADLDGMIPYRRNKPVWVTEASNNRGGVTPAQKAAQYLEFWQALRLCQPVQGVTYFVASASNPLWGWGGSNHCEVWIENGQRLGIGAAVGARTN